MRWGWGRANLGMRVRRPCYDDPVSAPVQRSWRPFAGLLIPVLVLLAVLVVGLSRHDQSQVVSEALARGETPSAPAVSMPAFSGPPVSLAAMRGHAVVLNFWASWCIPCRAEAPHLESIWREFHPRGLVVVGVDTQDLASPAQTFLTQYRLTFPAVRDPDGAIARRFGATGVPETFFISADGRILGKFPGEQEDPVVWRTTAEALLDGRFPQQ
jgi:cytochrome c biogenesis protein CcmG/thiol:disulfide interchange protein DsbE